MRTHGFQMQPPSVPLDETRRLAALRKLSLLDTPAEERFDRLTRIAARVFAVPAVTVSFVDETREWLKSAIGFPHEQIARRISLAAHAIGSGDLFSVPDLARDARFVDHPLLTSGPRFRFYAGQPLHSPDGTQPAVLSIYDVQPRGFGIEDRQLLGDLAAVVERELRDSGLSAPQLQHAGAGGREMSRVDPLTRLWTRQAMFDIARHELTQARSENSAVAMLIVDIAPVTDAVLRNGQPADAWVLGETARVLRSSLRPYDVLARFAGQEFAALLTGVDAANAADAAERVRLTIARELRTGTGRDVPVTIGASAAPASMAETETLVRAAQSALWSAKSRGGNVVTIHTLNAP